MEYKSTTVKENNAGQPPFSAPVLEWIALAISVLGSLSLLGSVLFVCRSGFDFTDEGYYLNWISNPWIFPSSVSQFGFIYHPLYRLVDGDIVLLRRANVLIIYTLSFLLSLTILQSLNVERVSSVRLWTVALALVLAASSLAFLGLWLPTPSYNSLAFTSLIVVAVGIVLTGREGIASIAGWIATGAGGALSFLAKPTSAALLGCAVLTYVVVTGRLSLRGILVCGLTAVLLLVVSALMIDGSLGKFGQRVLDGALLGGVLTPDLPFTRMFRVDSFQLGRTYQVVFALFLSISVAAILLSVRESTAERIGSAVITVVLVGLSVAFSAGALLPISEYNPFQPMQFWAINFASIVSLVVASRWTHRVPSRDGIALTLFFVFLPYVYAFGTGNNYWEQGGRVGLFWLLGGIIVSVDLAVKNAAWRVLTPIAAAGLLVTSIGVLTAMEDPYRQSQPLRLQTQDTRIGPSNTVVFLTDDAAIYTRDLRRVAENSGFKTGDPLLDLSGRNPGSVYAVGGRPPGAAWILAGYTGSSEFFSASLARENCSVLGATWILMEPGSSVSFAASLLQPFGIDISRDYQDVGAVRSMRGGSRAIFEQFLLRPSRLPDVANKACERARLATR